MKLLGKPLPLVVAVTVAAVATVVSGIAPYDRTTWFLEVAPVLVGVPLLLATARRFPLTPLLYGLLLFHALVLVMGGHYTYARVPLGFWAQEVFGFARNHYDRLGHLTQGFVPAVLVREILRRKVLALRGGWLPFLAVSVCLAFSAFYELIEWWTALAGGEAAESFLGTQGDVWDTQWDMFLALVGAILALATLSRLHERQLLRLPAAE